MIIFTIIVLIMLAGLVSFGISLLVTGASLILAFGDVIICVGLIYWLAKHLIKRFKKD